MSKAHDEAVKDPFKMGVLAALILIGKVMKADEAINTDGVIAEAEKLIAALPTGDKPLSEQDQHTLPLQALLNGLR